MKPTLGQFLTGTPIRYRGNSEKDGVYVAERMGGIAIKVQHFLPGSEVAESTTAFDADEAKAVRFYRSVMWVLL